MGRVSVPIGGSQGRSATRLATHTCSPVTKGSEELDISPYSANYGVALALAGYLAVNHAIVALAVCHRPAAADPRRPDVVLSSPERAWVPYWISSELSILDSPALSVYSQPPSFDPASCIFPSVTHAQATSPRPW